jgi:DNA-binding NarL/FixJ family response regulator
MEVVGEASNGMEAIELAKKLIPDVILMDIGMRQLNGLEATREIKRLFLP